MSNCNVLLAGGRRGSTGGSRSLQAPENCACKIWPLGPGVDPSTVILSEQGPRRFLQPGGGESKDLLLLFDGSTTTMVPQVSRIWGPGIPQKQTVSSERSLPPHQLGEKAISEGGGGLIPRNKPLASTGPSGPENEPKRTEKLRYMHRNPVKRDLA
jgi:hypothetical protein